MPYVKEQPRRRRRIGDNPGHDLVYLAYGYANEVDAETAVLTAAPSTFNGDQQQAAETEEKGGGAWEVTISYASTGKKLPETPTGSSETSFDMTGGSVLVKTSPIGASPSIYPAGAPGVGGAIGVTFDGDRVSIAGVEIAAPQFNYVETHFIAAATVTQAYINALHLLIAKVNNATWKGFAAGSVLFLGARGSRRGVDDWRIEFLFRVIPNVTGLAIGGITGIAKTGHQALWVDWIEDEDLVNNQITTKARRVFVETVYASANFASLGIGS
jgi:hypothetical protein